MNIEINKDIDKYKESVILGLTVRQLLFSVLSVAVGGGIVLLIYPYVGLTVSAYIVIPVVAPIALNGFYSYNGMTFMQMMEKKLHFAFHNRTLTYVSTEGWAEMQEVLAEEAENNKKKQGKTQAGNKMDGFEAARKGMAKALISIILAISAFAGAAIWYSFR